MKKTPTPKPAPAKKSSAARKPAAKPSGAPTAAHAPIPDPDEPASPTQAEIAMRLVGAAPKLEFAMKTKLDIARNWLPRYTGMPLDKFEKHIILVNFSKYVKMFAEHHGAEIYGLDKEMQACSGGGITMIKFGMGSAQAATIMDLLIAIEPRACVFLGKCGGLKTVKVGDLIIPLAGIRGEGTSDDYLPAEVPALPAFAMQKAISSTIVNYHKDYFTGTVYTTNRRVWEHDEAFKGYLRKIRAMAIDMETATLFIVAFHNHIPLGALLLVSDSPMTPEGVKTAESDLIVDASHTLDHLKIGIDSLKQIMHNGESLRHLRYER